MSRTPRFLAFSFLAVLFAVTVSAQERPLAGTVVDVDQGARRIQITTDANESQRVLIEIDGVSTSFHGFGTVIADKPEIFTGSSGLANVRLGDRVEIRGTSRAGGLLHAQRVTLLGRPVAAPQVGVGDTRPRTSVSTPTVAEARAAAVATLEGTVRQVNADDSLIVIQTTDRRMVNVTAYRQTPVWFRGEQYRIMNLEAGDRIRVEIDPDDRRANELIARRIDVVTSIRDGEGSPDGARITTLAGRVIRVDPTLDHAYVDDGRTQVRVDMASAEDAQGDEMHARDLRVDDRVEIMGSFNRVGDMFLASTVRFGTGRDPSAPSGPATEFDQPALVTITGTVTETLEDAATLSVRDRDNDRVVRIWASDELALRNRAGAYAAVSTLRVNDSVVITAFRDARGNLIAQTVRLRNR